MRPHKTCLYVEVKEFQWPIIYSLDYNISLCGLERLQSYDIAKGKNIFLHLKDIGLLDDLIIVRPNEAQMEDLRVVHSKVYLDNLKLTQFIEGVSQWGNRIGGLADLPRVGLLPNFLVDSKIMRPLRYQTGGTILAAKLALERGWSINLGGGFHHCSANRGGGFCAYADISLAVRFILNHLSEVQNVMIVDLDASQCNGPERDFLGDDRVYIFDMYNRQIYPQDGFAKRGIRRKIELPINTGDEEYLQLLRSNLDEALLEFSPDLVLYIAGASVVATDPIGLLSLTSQGLIERDQIVIQKMRTRGIPVAMVTGGGYGRDAARVMAQSILNLYHLGLISGPHAGLRPAVLTRHPSLIPEPHRGSNDDESSVWSRFRSLSVTNFAYLTAAMTSPVVLPNKTPDPGICTEQPEQNDADDEKVSDLLTRNELSRCFSMPNIDGFKQVEDFDANNECNLDSGE